MQFLLSLMNRLNKTEPAIFISLIWFGCFRGIIFLPDFVPIYDASEHLLVLFQYCTVFNVEVFYQYFVLISRNYRPPTLLYTVCDFIHVFGSVYRTDLVKHDFLPVSNNYLE